MHGVKREITRDEFIRLASMTKQEQEAELLPDGVPDEWRWGYGYYGHNLLDKGGKYYAVFWIGDSCD